MSVLFRLGLPPGNLTGAVETDVTLVLTERETESLELVVGLVWLAEEVDARFAL